MDPLMYEVPDEVQTDRLILRVPRPGDGAIVYPSVRATIEQLKPWMPWATDAYSADDGEIWCRRSFVDFHARTSAQFLMLRKEDRVHLGTLGAHDMNLKVRKAEIGYWLHTEHTGRGYMTEAVNALSDLLCRSLKIHRVQIRCDPKNLASAAVAKRCGYELEGRARHDSVDSAGKLRDTLIFSRLFDSA